MITSPIDKKKVPEYLEPDDNYWTIDIEADDLDATKIWCIVVQNVETEAVIRMYGETIYEEYREFVRSQGPELVLVGHNIIAFDLPTLNRLSGISVPVLNTVDTLVLSYLGLPHRKGGHSLKAWGERIDGDGKYQFDDWSRFSQEMLDYCEQDVRLTTSLYRNLIAELGAQNFSELSCEIEHRIADVIYRQQCFGFGFDVEAARQLYDELRSLEQDLKHRIQEVFPPKLVVKNVYNYREKADGTPYASFKRHLETYPKLQFNKSRTKYRVLDYEEFNIGSPKQRVERLLGVGWKPSEFTPKGQPKVTEKSLTKFVERTGNEAAKWIADWLVYNGRANMINTWLNNVGTDSRMHGKVFSCGANTRRMTHISPNTANIPSTRARFGKESRALWRALETDRRIVGCDAKGLEARLLVHYLDNPDAWAYFIEKDPHDLNRKAIEHLVGDQSDRDKSKTDFYALIFGAQDAKLGSNYGGGRQLGKRIRAALEKSIPGFDKFRQEVENEYINRKGWLKTIDGGNVFCHAKHAAVNYKIQSAGGVVMKTGAILLDDWAQGLDAYKVGDIHDEWQWDVHKRDAHKLAGLAVDAIRKAGEVLNLNAPMDGDSKIGKSWAETH